MGKKLPAIWHAEPHTLAKIEILKNYLNAWFPIIGSRFSKVAYIDGFSGPGYYQNHPEGSPLAALNVFRNSILKNPDLKVSNVSAFFFESDPRRFEILKERVSTINLPHRIHPIPLLGEFSVQMERLLCDNEFSDHFHGNLPLLIFADPFGGTGVPFRIFEKCLSSMGSELILNFDADGISRIYSGRNPGWEAQLTEVFGSDDWSQVLPNGKETLAMMSLRALDLYKSRLLSIPGVNYVWSFEMRGRSDRINYYLIFATRNRLGMEKMKEAMHAIDNSGHYCFSDAHFNQHVLFRDDDVSFYAKQLHKDHLGTSVEYATVDEFALTKTPFRNPKRILEYLSQNEMIEVKFSDGPKVRQHAFPADRVTSICFVNPGTRMEQGMLL